MAGSSSSRRRSRARRSSRRRETRSKPAPPPVDQAATPPSYSVEENSQGEWVNSRLNVKWPQQVDGADIVKHYYCDSPRDNEDNSASTPVKDRKRRPRREKRETREQQRDDSSSRSYSSKKDTQYIRLSIGSGEKEEMQPAHSRRERKRMTIQTSPQVSRKSYNSGYRSDETGGKKVDSIVFDTRSEMMRYKESGDILPSKNKRVARRKTSAADQRENEEYNRYFVGVRSRRGAEAKLKVPGEFALYYEKPPEGIVPAYVPLKIAYLSSFGQPYHFIVQCFDGDDGHAHYVVMQNKSDGKMFTSILALVKHYSLYSHVDTTTGRLETFSVPH